MRGKLYVVCLSLPNAGASKKATVSCCYTLEARRRFTPMQTSLGRLISCNFPSDSGSHRSRGGLAWVLTGSTAYPCPIRINRVDFTMSAIGPLGLPPTADMLFGH